MRYQNTTKIDAGKFLFSYLGAAVRTEAAFLFVGLAHFSFMKRVLAGFLLSLSFCTALAALTTEEATAHGGRTNSQGCHKEKSSGTKHCH